MMRASALVRHCTDDTLEDGRCLLARFRAKSEYYHVLKYPILRCLTFLAIDSRQHSSMDY